MKINSILFFALAFAVSVVSCTKSSDPVKGKYQTGVLVANQGNFGSGNGDVTYFNPSSKVSEQAIYKNANGGTSFSGDVLQSISLDGDKGYLVLSGSNKIEVVDNNTFTLSKTFTDPKLDKPQYLEVINDKAYISVWGPYNSNFLLTRSYILVMDTKTLALVDTITTDLGVENLLYNGKYLFASNNNFGGSNTVSVIDPSTDKLIKQIVLSAGPAGMVLDANGKLWVITQGTFGSNNGVLYRINPSTFAIEQVIDLSTNPGNSICTTPDKKSIYYSVNNQIYKIAIDATSTPTSPFINASDVVTLNALAVSNVGDIYLGDALNYSTAGMAYVYDSDGNLKTSFPTGITPTQFVFK
ncbi:MAG: SMP-30/gluconolactonase/LRE family protein [Bacteroidetes bacterium]|nr:SMP-30/gluconolactonase/LRE family protein [Bacteroidota bacterium]